jgi:serine phosphatase RsbU (regulator of sigma subunit)
MLHNHDQRSNPALGLFDSFRYTTSSMELSAQDRFIFFTDGVYDLENNGELLSVEWLRGAFQRRREMTLPHLFDDLLRELRTVAGNEEFCDDMCLVGMEVIRGNGAIQGSDQLRFLLRPR